MALVRRRRGIDCRCRFHSFGIVLAQITTADSLDLTWSPWPEGTVLLTPKSRKIRRFR